GTGPPPRRAWEWWAARGRGRTRRGQTAGPACRRFSHGMLTHVPPPSPKDRFITVYGRKPVLEALADPALTVDKVIVADNARGPSVSGIRAEARRWGVSVQTATAHRVKVLAGNGRHDQGVLADVVAPRMLPLADFLDALAPDAPCAVLVL